VTADAQTIEEIVDACLARAEVRLTSMVNERNTNVISATAAIVEGLHQEIQSLDEAVMGLSENITARRRMLDERLIHVEARLDVIEDHIPAAVLPDPSRPPLRTLVETYREETAQETAKARATAAETRRWLLVFMALIVVLELAQWALLIVLLSRS
jgi:hypothetical protein